jgi:hypothetical protein
MVDAAAGCCRFWASRPNPIMMIKMTTVNRIRIETNDVYIGGLWEKVYSFFMVSPHRVCWTLLRGAIQR